MATVNPLKNEILELQKENDPYKKQLTALLLKQSTEQLNAEQKRELAANIQVVNSRISENNQLILVKENQILVKENQILESKKQIAADKQIQLELIKNEGLELIKNQGKSTASPILFKFRR